MTDCGGGGGGSNRLSLGMRVEEGGKGRVKRERLRELGRVTGRLQRREERNW